MLQSKMSAVFLCPRRHTSDFKKEQDKGRCTFMLRRALHRRAKPVGSDVAGAVLVL